MTPLQKFVSFGAQGFLMLMGSKFLIKVTWPQNNNTPFTLPSNLGAALCSSDKLQYDVIKLPIQAWPSTAKCGWLTQDTPGFASMWTHSKLVKPCVLLSTLQNLLLIAAIVSTFKHTMVSLLCYSLLCLQSLLPLGDIATSVVSSSFTLLTNWKLAARIESLLPELKARCQEPTNKNTRGISYPCVAYFVKLVSFQFLMWTVSSRFVHSKILYCTVLFYTSYNYPINVGIFLTPDLLQLLPNYISMLLLCHN